MDVEIDPVASGHFGITSRILHGATELVGVSYGELYRLAIHSGTLRGHKVTGALIEESPHETDRRGNEFYQVLERLGVAQSIPRGMRGIRRALKSLIEQDISVSTRALSDLFLWLETYLEVFYGGHANTFHRIAYNTECLRSFLLDPEEFSQLIGKASDELINQLGSFDNPPVEVIRESIRKTTQAPTDYELCRNRGQVYI